MAYFSELDENNVVLRTIVVHENDAENGEVFCSNLLGGRWLQTFEDGSKRKQYAGIGYTYNETADVFVAPQPFPSWSLDNNYDWQSPVQYPSDGKHYYWDEPTTTWIEATQ
jgi:hypothetical protein